jgi:dTDP-glucose 4,6-dehydratase
MGDETKRILLTGIGGSISAHFLAHIFHNTNWDIVGIDSFRHKGWTDRVKLMLDSHPDWKERLTVITHDLAAPISPIMREKIGHIDYVINMASLSDVEASIKDPVPFIQNNVSLVINMLEYAREAKPEVFIQISTDEVYGASASKFGDLRKEWDPIIPSNPYAASKACQEAIAISYWRTYGVPVIITNTMNNISELQQASKFPVMIQKAIMRDEEVIIHGREGQIGSRSYIHSRNFADAVLFILKNTLPHMHVPNSADRPDRYNIAGDKQLDNLELAQVIAKLMGKELKYKLVDSHSARPGHDPHYGLDMTKLRTLGWKSPLSFEESLKNVIDWQTEHPEWILIEDHTSYDKKRTEK